MIRKKYLISRFNRLPENLSRIIFLSRDLAKRESVGVYLVGGFVRDLILGKENFDLDIVSEKDGIEFASKLSKITGAHLVRHRDFGTAALTLKDGNKVDTATSRKERYLRPAALPLVQPGNIAEDLERRDFTINAMACHIDYGRFGEFVDIFGGLKDLRKGIIRFLHEGSFVDDPTRIIRAVRFEQRFGFKIEKETARFIKQAKNKKMLEQVQKHRIRDELILIFKEERPFKVIKRLKALYNLSFIEKGLKQPADSDKVFKRIGDSVGWFTRNCPKRRKPDTWLMYLMFFLSGLKLRQLDRMLNDYAFFRSDRIRIYRFMKTSPVINKLLTRKKISAIRVHQLLEPLSYEVLLLFMSCVNNKLVIERIREFFLEHHHKRVFITGDDLLSLGIKPGPCFKKILQKVLRAKINNKIHTKEQELDFAKKIISRNNI